MVRELAITVYLFVFQILFSILKSFPQKTKTTFVASFGDNILCTINELEKQTDDQIVILKSPQCKTDFGTDKVILKFGTVNVIDWVHSVYHLATSQKVIVDNYYGFLAVSEFKSNVACIQLWHAAGAIKQFALKDPSITDRHPRAYARFKKVYHRFDHVVVGSERMASIFRESFDITSDKILRTGVPRTDFFYDKLAIKKAKQLVQQKYPSIKGKKIILYAPTYRDDEMNVTDLHLNIDKMHQSFRGEYMLMLRLHPAVNGHFQNKYPDFVINASSYSNINHLLVTTDILITDYSSIPFEFSLLNKPMIFFAYDLKEYTELRGFWEDYETLVPGPIVETTEEVTDLIRNKEFDLQKVRRFAAVWNQYSKGNSGKSLIKSIYTGNKKAEKVAKMQP